MEIILAIISSSFVTGSVASVFYFKAKSELKNLERQIEEQKISLQILKESEFNLEQELKSVEAAKTEIALKKTESETKLDSLQTNFEQIKQLLNQTQEQKETLSQELSSQRQKTSLANQEIENLQEEAQKFEDMKKQFMEYTRSSIMEISNNVSSKLLDDHKREAETAKKENEKIVKETTENLHKHFQTVFESVNQLNDRVNQSSQSVDLVRRALLEPAGAGSLAEITLENIFKSSGLIANQDYKMQYWVESENSGGLKPDAVVFLPGDNVLVVDSKASKFFTEMADSADEEQHNQASESLKKTMNKHLKDLIKRNYLEAIESQIGKSAKATILMFLPSDTALDKLRSIDAKFTDNAWRERIIPVGPSGLVTMLINASNIIANAKQDENAQKIMGEIKNLLSSVTKMHEHANSLGKSLKTSINHYDKFAGSFDRTFMSKAKKISKMGANMPKLEDMKKLERYSVEKKDYTEIDGHATEEDDQQDSTNVQELTLEFER